MSETAMQTASSASDLPVGWELIKLADLLEKLETGKRPKGGVQKIKSGVPSLGGEHLNADGGFKFEKIKFVPKEFAESMQKGHITGGDILVVKDGATTAKTSIVRDSFPHEFAVINEHVFLCRCKEEIDPKYVFYYLWSSRGQQQILSDFRGAAQGGISKGFAELVEVPLAPLDQQKVIVAEIEKQFSRLDEAVASLKRVKANLKRYKAAVLKAAVEGKLSSESSSTFEPDNFLPLSELIESLGQGWSPKCEREASLSDDDWGVIKTTAIQSMEFDSSENKKLPNDLEPRQKHEIVAGDMLITRAGPRKRVGVSCLVRSTRPRLMLCDKAYRLKLNLDLVLPEYFELALNSPEIIDELDALKTGISDSGLNLTQKRFLELRLPIPALEQQEEIVRAVESKLSVIEKIELEFNRTESRLASSRQSILGQAFQGELVDDEICAA